MSIEINKRGILIKMLKEKTGLRFGSFFISGAIAMIFAMILAYLILPVLNPGFAGSYIYLLLVLILMALVALISSAKTYTKVSKKKVDNPAPSKLFITMIVVIILYLLVFLIAGGILSTPLLHSSAYKNLIGTVKTEKFSTKMQPIDTTTLPIVAPEYAENLADKVLGQAGAIGSQVKLGKLTRQDVNGKPYYVAPLVHSSFFKWLSNKETDGYVMVSATDANDVKLVTTLDNGQPAAIKYQPEAYFGDDLKRHIYSVVKNQGITDFTFEINDSGKPYWTATLYRHTIGLSGAEATGIALIDATSGEIKIYSIKDMPSWVDRVQPTEFIAANINYYGRYMNGAINFSGKGKMQLTGNLNIVYNNGHCYYYGGMTSIGADNATLGFVLVDAKTMETTMFDISGATESAAMKSAEGKVQQLGYTASTPLLINVESIPTYFIPLNDKNNLTKLYAMVNVKNFNIVDTGATINECKFNYLSDTAQQGSNSNVGSLGKAVTVTGTVDRIGSYITGGNTYYNLYLKEFSDKLFTVNASLNLQIPVTQQGDTITVNYVDTGLSTVTITSFSNSKFSNVK